MDNNPCLLLPTTSVDQVSSATLLGAITNTFDESPKNINSSTAVKVLTVLPYSTHAHIQE
jgi:hypothetical protein